MQRVLIIGASGLVGRALSEELQGGFDVYGTYNSSLTKLPSDKQFRVDIQDINKLSEITRSINPDIVISCVGGEFKQQLILHKELAIELENNTSRMYYFSTTNVFDGDESKPHVENDIPTAQSDYGTFKIECETILNNILGDRAIIIRIPAIWGKDAPRWNSLQENIRNNAVIDVYSNLINNNLVDIVLAKQLRFIIENELNGIFHLGSVDMMTHAQFYEHILNKLGRDKNLLRYRLYGDKAETCYFRLNSLRDDIPDYLLSTNEDIISYLLG
ncbi:sugar nucleotide-binding protein [Alicyclobacillus sp. ALC3]|uniref:sugar nucleotide-binding protein n=1 Tax=Alicyclobacillus sp. ALC3 TaxID=2796143 RepID=UPI002377F2D9|nr:sugar nucleotide-binding protein [Alicyclobacillus sp. ALC3]WDL99228.1 sugar nucleotide-binding protein [Alicyclobacillus sp. ALC3]